MSIFRRAKNIAISKAISVFPALAEGFIDSYAPWESEDVPWTALSKPINESVVAVVTTAGVHHADQQDFDMNDSHGDPSYRVIDRGSDSPLKITHDYYDHSSALKDMNVVLPLDRLDELAEEGIIGGVARRHYGIMGHVERVHIHTLISVTAPAIAAELRDSGVDIVLLTPG